MNWLMERGKFKEALLSFIKDKEIAFMGGVAARAWGVRPSLTDDYDFLVSRVHFKEMAAFMDGQGAELMGTATVAYPYYIARAKLPVDVIVADSDLYKAALKAAVRKDFKGHYMRIVPPLFLAAMKVLSYPERADLQKKQLDLDDLRRLLTGTKPKAHPDELRTLLKQHAPELVPVLDDILKKLR